MAPPFTLVRSRSRPSSCSTARCWAAKASFTSTRSRSRAQPRPLQGLPAGGHRSHAHVVRIDAGDRPAHQPAQRAPALGFRAPLPAASTSMAAPLLMPLRVAGRDGATL